MEQTINKSPKENIRAFTLHDIIFAWFCYIAGYLFCRAFPVTENSLGGMLFVFMIFIFTAVFLKTKGSKFTVLPSLAAISAMLISASLVLSSNSFIHFFAYLYALAAYCYFIYASTGNSLRKGFSDLLVIDWFKSVFLMPFYSFEKFELFHGMFHGRIKKSGKVLLKLLAGIGIAVVPTAVALALLSYDEGFTDLIEKIFDFDNVNIFSHVVSLAFAIPVAMYLYGLYISSVDNKLTDVLGEKQFLKQSDKMKIAPLATVISAVIPLLFVYILFFVSQWQYYVSGFTGQLPESFSHAEYAREGFFQLCAVSVINLAVIVAIIMLTKKSRVSSVLLKLLTVIFSLFTLVLISTAIAKMVMYIESYGLTPKRVYATWFMLVLTLIFLIIALSRFIPRISAVSLSAAVLVVAFAALALCNIDGLIAKYNVDRYISGTLETVDFDAMRNLGDAAIPEMVRLAEYIDEQNGTDISELEYKDVKYQKDIYSTLARALLDYKSEINESQTAGDGGIFSFTIVRARAEVSLREIGLME